MRLEERIKKHEDSQVHIKSNIFIALVIIMCYVLVFFIGKIIGSDVENGTILGWLIGTDSSFYLFGWLLHKRVYWIAMLISTIPALFGKYRFSFTTVVSFIAGLLLGEFFEDYDGWFVWAGIFLISIIAGIVLEVFVKHNITFKSKKGLAWLMVTFASCLLLTILVVTSPPDLNDIIGREPNFKGTVLEVSDTSLLIEVSEEEDEYRSSDIMSVSLDIQLEDGKAEYHVGDEVIVYYDGSIAESYPAQIHTVYAILLQ